MAKAVRYNKVRCLFKLHLSCSNLTNRNVCKRFQIETCFTVDSFFFFSELLLFQFDSLLLIFIDASCFSHWLIWLDGFKYRFVTWLFTFLHDVIDEIQSTAYQMSRNVNRTYRKLFTSTEKNRHSLDVDSNWIEKVGCNFMQRSMRVLLRERTWDWYQVVTANEPVIVIQLKHQQQRTHTHTPTM